MEDSANLRSFSLSELLRSVRRCIEHTYPTRYWVRAEVSDLRRSGAGGHGYLELLEKGAGGDIVARVRATIWSTAYQQIERALAQQGLGSLSSGMNVLALVSLSYHELYGLSLNIADIDPRYSLGELARLRQETIARLKRQGLLEMNKELELPEPLQRLAIISSPTAAGYGDFMRQIEANSYGVKLYTALFRAQMQGEQTTDSILSALERILRHQEHFDAVVIIRGGGAVSELRAFDDYRLCESCAQYPLPIITGIGHERDVSVLDLVAHSSFKTPTAVASYLIEGLATELGRVAYCSERLPRLLERLSLGRGQSLQLLSSRLQQTAQRSLTRAQYSLSQQQSPSRSTSPTPTGGTSGAAPPAAAPSAATRASTQSQLSAARALRAGDTALPPRQYPTARLQHRQARWPDPDLGQRTAEGRGTGALLLPRFNTRTRRGLAPKAKPALRPLRSL